MRSFPYIRLIRFLVSARADVTASLRALRLPYPDWLELEQIKSALLGAAQPPVVAAHLRGSDVQLRGSEAFLAWAEVHGIRELWERRLDGAPLEFEDACRIFSNPAVRTVVATLTMANFDGVEVQELLYSKYQLRVDAKSVDLFRAVFWDVNVMSRQDWVTLMQELEPDQRSVLARAFSGHGKDGVKLALGIVPDVDLGAILGDVAAKAYDIWKSELERPAPDYETALKMAKVAIAAAEKKKRHGGGPSRSLSEEVQMQLHHEKERIPSMAEVLEADKKKV